MKKTILFAVLAAIMIATPVLAAVFQANLTVVESGGTTYTRIGVTTPMNVDWMATNGYMAATGRDTRVVLGSNTYAHMLREGYINFAVPVNANSTVTYEMTTDNSLADMSIVPGYGGYVTVLDDPALELGNNFEIEIDDGTTTNTGTFIDTTAGAGKYLVYKQNAFMVDAITASTLKATMLSAATTSNLAPSGVGNETAIPTLFGAATHWQANLTNDGDTSYVANAVNAYARDLYATDDLAAGDYTIISVVIHIVAKHEAGGANAAAAKTSLRTYATNYEGVANSLPVAGAYTDFSTTYATNPNTGLAWTEAEVNAMEIGVSIEGSVTAEAINNQ